MNAKPLTTLALACVLAPLALYAGAATAADNCDGIAAQIDARMRAGGLHDFALVVVDASVATSGRVVGTCASGTRRIVHVAAAGPVGAGAAAAALPRRPATAALAGNASSSAAPGAAIATATTTVRDSAADRIPTECKDGSVVIGPNCNDPRARRMTKAQIDEAAAAAAGAAEPASAPAPAAAAASAPDSPMAAAPAASGASH